MNLYNVFCCWLIAVKINTVIEKKCKLTIIRILTENSLYPVILREDCGNYLH